jgi:hypothetical protein
MRKRTTQVLPARLCERGGLCVPHFPLSFPSHVRYIERVASLV